MKKGKKVEEVVEVLEEVLEEGTKEVFQEGPRATEEIVMPASSVPQMTPTQDYFTQEVDTLIREMPEKEMLRELLVLEGTRSWIAILKYNQIRLSQSQTAIFSGDPIKEPTNMIRNQGIMLGISDLQNAVIMLKQERAEEAEEANKAKD